MWLAREGAFDPVIQSVYDSRALLPLTSRWVVVRDESDAIPAIHSALASKEHVKILVIAGSAPARDAVRRDAGLFALTYGGATVASVCGGVDSAQLAAAISEAVSYSGPSVVIALEGCAGAADAVATGEWPLYRWDPTTEALTVDSPKLRADIATFLDREAALSLLARPPPSASESAAEGSGCDPSGPASEAALAASYRALVRGVELPPLAILFGSDGGNAEGLAKRLAADARERGFPSVTISPADHNGWTSIDTLAAAPLVVFIVSTAGQGEFPANSRAFWTSLSTAVAAGAAGGGGAPLSATRFAVFGLGDSLYWPRKEHVAFYNKPSLDLEGALAALGGIQLLPRGLGDDQEVGGFAAGFRAWVPELWASLGLGESTAAKASGAEGRVRGNESIKITSNLLRGTIAQGLNDTTTGALNYEDTQLTKVRGWGGRD